MRLLLAACCLPKRVAHPWTLKGGVKPRQGKPTSVNTLQITVEETLSALEMCLHGKDDHPEKRLKNSLFSPQNGPLRGTAARYMPY